MKKITIIILIVVMLTASFGCGTKDEPKNHNPAYSHDLNISPSIRYVNFEECVAAATDIVKAKCKGVELSDTQYEIIYEFEILKRFCGEDVGSTIYLYIPTYFNLCTSYQYTDISYEIGKDYYLILSRYITVYNEREEYSVVSANIFLPADDLTKSTMHGEELTKHSNIKKLSKPEHIESYLEELLSERDGTEKLYHGNKFITSDDPATIIRESEYVFKVAVVSKCGSSITRHVTHFECRIISPLKGDRPAKNTVTISFPSGVVNPGDECILALTNAISSEENIWFDYSSKNSYFDVSELDTVLQYINEG